eukprot:scaffold119109_cov68-Phaeocystis_antarctica.AAC.3
MRCRQRHQRCYRAATRGRARPRKMPRSPARAAGAAAGPSRLPQQSTRQKTCGQTSRRPRQSRRAVHEQLHRPSVAPGKQCPSVRWGPRQWCYGRTPPCARPKEASRSRREAGRPCLAGLRPADRACCPLMGRAARGATGQREWRC